LNPFGLSDGGESEGLSENLKSLMVKEGLTIINQLGRFSRFRVALSEVVVGMAGVL